MREGNIFSLFTLVAVGGGYPIPGLDRRAPHPADRGVTPFQVQMRVPHPRSRQEVPHPADGPNPIPGLDRRYPIPGLDRDEEYLILLTGGTPSRS